MKVLLKEDVDNLGYAGEVHDVANGFGRNFLIPQGLAVIATPGTMKQAEIWRKKAEARRAEQQAEYEALSAQINDLVLTFKARAGETGKLYGSVTTAMIADEMNETLGTDIDRRKVGVEPLRQLGEHKVVVRLSADFQPELTAVIESDEEETVVLVDTDDLLAPDEGEEVEPESEEAGAAEPNLEESEEAEEVVEPVSEEEEDGQDA